MNLRALPEAGLRATRVPHLSFFSLAMLFKTLLLLVAFLQASSAFMLAPPQGAVAACRSPAAAVTMAHHVQKKATRGHNAFRPKKKRPSDIYRKAPSYPAMPDIPWYTKLESGEKSE